MVFKYSLPQTISRFPIPEQQPFQLLLPGKPAAGGSACWKASHGSGMERYINIPDRADVPHTCTVGPEGIGCIVIIYMGAASIKQPLLRILYFPLEMSIAKYPSYSQLFLKF